MLQCYVAQISGFMNPCALGTHQSLTSYVSKWRLHLWSTLESRLYKLIKTQSRSALGNRKLSPEPAGGLPFALEMSICTLPTLPSPCLHPAAVEAPVVLSETLRATYQ